MTLRIFLIDENDKISRMPATIYGRLMDRDPKEKLPQYAKRRLRFAEAIVELKNKKPVKILRVVYSYFQFDPVGMLDENYLREGMRLAMLRLPPLVPYEDNENVISASHRLAEKKYQDEYKWTPSRELQQRIMDKTLGQSHRSYSAPKDIPTK